MYLYEYAYTGHFWVKGYEYLRQLEYRLAILRDKYDYLGEEYCTEEEKRLAALVEFPPLNYCCYPAVPGKVYRAAGGSLGSVGGSHYLYERTLCGVRRYFSRKKLETYRKHPTKFRAKRIAAMLHKKKHAAVVDLLTRRLQEATAEYPRRFLGDELERKYEKMLKMARKKTAGNWRNRDISQIF